MSSHVEVLLEEYRTLKAEQCDRIARRDHLTYLCLAASAAVGYAAIQAHLPVLLLTLPLATYALGWTRIMNDGKVTEIGRYVAEELTPLLGDSTGANPGRLLRWENGYRSSPRRPMRKIRQMIVDVLVFVVPALLADVAWEVMPGRHPAWGWVAAVAGMILAVDLAVEIIDHADLVRSPSPVRGTERPPSAPQRRPRRLHRDDEGVQPR